MNTDYLHEFTELAKRLSFTETARFLNMSQSTLSKHVSQFEKELKLTLFERTGNTLELTKAGAMLLTYAYQIIDAQSDFYAQVSELRKIPPPRLTISGLTDEGPSTEILGFLISLLSGKYGASFLEIKSRFNRDLREMLSANEVDIIFDPAPSEEDLSADYIETLHIADLRLAAIMSRDHPLAQRQSLSFSDLRNEVLLKYEGLYLNRSWCHIEKKCQDHGFTPRTRSCHCASVAALFAMCANLESSILLVGCNFESRVPTGIKPFCTTVQIADEDAAIPLFFVYRNDNPNPVLKEAIALIGDLPSPPLLFA